MMWSDLWKYWFSLKWSKLIYFQKLLKNFSLKNWRCLWNFSNCQLSLAFQNLFNITSTAHQNHTSFVLVNFGRTWNEMNWSDLWKWQFELKWSKELHFQDDFCWSDADKFLKVLAHKYGKGVSGLHFQFGRLYSWSNRISKDFVIFGTGNDMELLKIRWFWWIWAVFDHILAFLG